MPRLRHSTTGVVVNVDEALAAKLGSEWVDTVPTPAAPPATRRRRTPAKSKAATNARDSGTADRTV